MRLSVFAVEISSQQLIIDLQKLYKGHLDDSVLTEQALSNSLQDTKHCYYATMFNNRHIGAVKVSINGQQAVLSQLCIRDITRRRGVGKNLLKQVETFLIEKSIDTIEYDMNEVHKDEFLATQAFFADSHYLINGALASKKL